MKFLTYKSATSVFNLQLILSFCMLSLMGFTSSLLLCKIATKKLKRKCSYIGDGRFIHSSSSRGVIISHIDENYYATNYHSSGFVSRNGYAPQPKDSGKDAKVKSVPVKKAPETQPLKFEIPKDKETEMKLNQAIESRIDSIYSSFLD